MKKVTGFIILLLVIVAAIFVYNSGLLTPEKASEPGDTVIPPASEQERKRTVTVTLYFPNAEYVRTGNEELPRVLAVEREITVKGDNLEEAVLNELRTPPPGEKMLSGIRGDLRVIEARTEGNTVYVNFSGENMHGGSLEEILLVEQVVRTMTALEGIEKVQFLVDGEKRETLMGHLSTDEPLGKEDL